MKGYNLKRFASSDYISSQAKPENDILATASLRVKQNAKRATLIFITASIYEKLFHRQLKVAHSLGDGLYCIDLEKNDITDEMLTQLKQGISDFISTNESLELVEIPRKDLLKKFVDAKRNDKVGVIKTISKSNIKCIKCGEFVDYLLEPMETNLSRLPVYEIRKYHVGFVLRLPTLLSPDKIQEWVEPTSQSEMFDEYTEWAELIGVDNIAKINDVVYHKKVEEIKWVCEGLHQRKLAKLAIQLIAGYPAKRVITIAGPSSSNKTTFAKRLSIALKVN